MSGGDGWGGTEQERYISVDVEAAGPIPGTYSMLSIGACVVGTPTESYYAELKPINANAIPEALAVGKFDLARLAIDGQEPADALASLRGWVERVSVGRRPVMVGFNASFDWSFVNWYCHTYLGENMFGIGALDIKAYYMGVAGCRWDDTRSSRLPEHFRPAPANAHNALSDAQAQAEVFGRLLSILGRNIPT